MIFNLNSSGTLTTLEARERIQSGITPGTIDVDYDIDTTSMIDLDGPLWSIFYGFGVYFETLDGKVSLFPDGSIEANEFLEGVRSYIDNVGRLSVVFLKEIE